MSQEAEFTFLHFSEILGRKVLDPDGKKVARIDDLVATTGEMYPIVRGLILRGRKGKRLFASVSDVGIRALGSGGGISVEAEKLVEPKLIGADFLIRELLYDKQIVDVQGAKVERVNDVQFLLTDRLRVVHVDVGFTGLLRRLGVERLVRRLWKVTRRPLRDELISWKFVQPLAESDEPGQPLRLKIEQAHIRDLHPGELADIFEDLSKEEVAAIVHSLDPEAVADILEEADEDVQAAVISQLDPEKAADILEEMDPGEAADILQNIPDAHSEEIIAEVEDDERAQIEPLTDYEEETAAGLMTPEFVSVGPGATVAEALEEVRRLASEIEAIYYVYVLDGEQRLKGVTTLRTLFCSRPEQKVEEIMEKRLVTLAAGEELDEIAETFQKYHFLGCPVVDAESKMIGVILIKHAFDELLPEFRREGRA